MTDAEKYEQMDEIEVEVTNLKAKFQSIARTLPRCVIVCIQLKQKVWHGGCSAPAGTVVYWGSRVGNHREFTKDIDIARTSHRRWMENMLTELRKHNKEFKDTQYVRFEVREV